MARYEIIEQLSDGIARARDAVLGRKVVVARGVKIELAKRASEVTHPALAMILDLGQDDAGAFVVYENVPGPTLRERIPEGIPQLEIAKLASDLGAALSAIHEAGLAHGAVAPDQVRFGKSGPKLLGLGLAEGGTAEADQRALAALVYEVFARVAPSDPPKPLAELDDTRSPILRARLDAALARTFEGKKPYPTCRDLGTMIAGAIDPPHSGAFPALRLAEIEARSRTSIVPKPVRQAQNVIAGLAVVVIVLLIVFGRRAKEEPAPPKNDPPHAVDAGKG